MEGYDAKFEPALDKRFECPICLLAQREPMQTLCGHRFCANCIMRALKYVSLKGTVLGEGGGCVCVGVWLGRPGVVWCELCVWGGGGGGWKGGTSCTKEGLKH